MTGKYAVTFSEEEIKDIISSIENAPVDGYGSVSKNKLIYTMPYRKLLYLLCEKCGLKFSEVDEELTGIIRSLYGEDGTSGTPIEGSIAKDLSIAKEAIGALQGHVSELSENDADQSTRLETVEGKTEANANTISTAESNIAALQETTSKDLGAVLSIDYDNSAYKLTIKLLNKEGATLGEAFEIDLPLESVVVRGEYLPTTKILVLTLQNGNIINIPLGDIIDGLISTSEKGQPNGVAELNANGVVPESQLPPLDYVKKTGDTMSGALQVTTAGTVAKIAGVGYTITFNGNGYSYGYDGIHTLGENLGYYRFPNIDGMHILAVRTDLVPLQTQLELHSQVLMQSGLMYTADNVNTWNERVTAGGANVLDGSKAVLKKVAGSTVACRNIWNGTWELGTINTNTGEENTSSDSLVSSFVQVNGGETIAISGNLAELYMCFVYDKDKNFLSRSDWSAKTLQVENNAAFIRIMQYQSTVEPTNVQVEYGTTATEYQPYFTGLKSASFGGIESTNEDGTKTSTFEFPKIEEMPLGKTIDFEQKKIMEEYAYLEQSTPFTEEQLANYTDYIISQDRKSIMYKLETPIVTDFTDQQSAIGNEYTAYKNGTETVLDNAGNAYGANNTMTINYVFVNEVQE